MEFEHVAVVKELLLVFRVDCSDDLVGTGSVPVESLTELGKEVDQFAVRDEDYDFGVLVRVKEHQEVNESVLGRDFEPELFYLHGDC
jgi:hypothetical protein